MTEPALRIRNPFRKNSARRPGDAPATEAGPGRTEYSIDELAREAGTTVRNVRVYRERGLLPAPLLRGRTGIYTQAHLARLRVIGRMLERGYSLANVRELISAWEGGHDIAKLLGLEDALTSPWTDEAPTTLTLKQLTEMFGSEIKPSTMAKAKSLGVIQREGLRAHVPSMKLLDAGATLVREGVPLEELLDVIQGLRANVERVADALVQLIAKYVFDRYGEGSIPPPEETARLAELIWKLRPLAMQAVDSEVARAMERSANRFLGDRLELMLDLLHEAPSSTPHKRRTLKS
ncbi:MAG: MerR family transcriptional regulator [Stenotrophobium sp.]